MELKIEHVIEKIKKRFEGKRSFNEKEQERIRNYFELNNTQYKIGDIVELFEQFFTLLIIQEENTISSMHILKFTKHPCDLNDYYLNRECQEYSKYFLTTILQESYLIQEIDINQYYSLNWVYYQSKQFSLIKNQIVNLRLIEFSSSVGIDYHEKGVQISECTNLKKIEVELKYLFIEKDSIEDLFNNFSNFLKSMQINNLINSNIIIGKHKNIEYCEFIISGLDENYYSLTSAESIANCISSYQLKLLQLNLKVNTSSFGDQGVTSIAQVISKCTQIQELNCEFVYSQVNLKGFQNFLIGICSCSTLKKLHISFEQNNLNDKQQLLELRNEFNQLINLVDVSFNLANCKISSIFCETLFSFISTILSIEKLHFLLQNNLFTENGVFSAMTHLAALPKLNELLINLKKNTLSKYLPQFGKAIGLLKHLKYLTIEADFYKLDEESANEIGNGIGQNQNLKSLTLLLQSTYNQFDYSQKSVQFLMNGIISCKQITSLNLNFYKFFQDKGFEYLSQSLGEFPKLSQLTILNSSEYNPSDKQIVTLAKSISKCQEITSFSTNLIFGIGFEQFINELKNSKKLSYVSLNSTNVYYVHKIQQVQLMRRKIRRLVNNFTQEVSKQK